MIPPRQSPSAAVLLLALVAMSPACSQFYFHEERELVVPELALQDIWSTLERTMRSMGHPVDIARSDRGKRVMLSKWNEKPMAFQNGRRTRMHARIDRDGSDEPWTVYYYVEKEIVTDMERELTPSEGDWEWAGHETELEQILRTRLMLEFGQELDIQVEAVDPYGRR